MIETWKPIWFNPKYSISNYGRVINNSTLKILKPIKHSEGYLRVGLRRGNIKKMFYIHYLVASAFVPDCTEESIVDHWDRDKTNNRSDNLRWVTYSQNNRNKNGTGKSKQRGVYYNKRSGKWVAQISLGSFLTKKEATKVYNKVCKDLFNVY